MILDELAAFARKRVAADQAKTPLADIKAQAKAMPKGTAIRRAIFALRRRWQGRTARSSAR